MNTHNDFLDNAVDDELETEDIEDLTTDMCSDMQNDTEKMCLSLRDDTCRDSLSTDKVMRNCMNMILQNKLLEYGTVPYSGKNDSIMLNRNFVL